MIFWWFLKVLLQKRKSSKTLGNHQKIIKKSSFCLKKPRTCQNLGFSRFFQQNDYFLMIFWWFPRFCLIFSFEAKPSKIIKQSSKNNQKIIVLLEKTKKTCQNLGFSWFFQQNDDFLMISWWFLKVLLHKNKSNKT